jgi:hypothetical protein
MKRVFAAFGVGVLFALGLGISGMTLPAKVIGFLDVTGQWDPALAFVMGGAVVVYAIGYRLVTRREAPQFAASFSLPKRRDIDLRLLGGAALFGAGWGLGGYCPGPALVSTVTLTSDVMVFVGAMFVGMRAFALTQRVIEARGATEAEAEVDEAASAPLTTRTTHEQTA